MPTPDNWRIHSCIKGIITRETLLKLTPDLVHVKNRRPNSNIISLVLFFIHSHIKSHPLLHFTHLPFHFRNSSTAK